MTDTGSGMVSDRPWGVTLGAIALRRLTGELVLVGGDGKRYAIAFVHGAVVGASSPLVADSVARIALTSHLISSTQVGAIAKRLAAQSERDEIELLGEIARLSSDHLDRLRQRVLVQRTARTFAVDHGEWTLSDRVTLASAPGVEVDVGAGIYLGARMNLSDERLGEDLRRLGARFVLVRDAQVAAARYGFGDDEQPIIDALRVGTSLPELDARHREIVPRTAQAVIYALVSTGMCDAVGKARTRDAVAEPAAAPDAAAPTPARTVTPSALAHAAAPAAPARVAPPPVASPPAMAEPEAAPARSRTVTFEAPTVNRQAPRGVTMPRTYTATTSPAIPRTLTPRRSAFIVRETIASGTALIERGADHFALLGLTASASLDAIRSAYVALACQLHPDKLPALAPDETHDAQRLFAHINTAFAVLTDPVRRADYLGSLGGARPRTATGEPAPASGPAPERPADKLRQAQDAFQRGMAALRRDDMAEAIRELSRATELSAADVDYHAMLAWARFCGASDKPAIAVDIRRALEKAVHKSPRPVLAQFYLGRVERMLGRAREALYHFRAVVAVEPEHAEAAAEIRMLEARAASRR